MFRVALLTAAVLVAVPATAQAHWDLTPDGQPLITTSAEATEGIELRVCPPDANACTEVEWDRGPGWPSPSYRPGETAVGTTFEVYRPYNDTTVRSPAWQGRVTATAAPSISGSAIAGQHVQPTGGTWSGGWGDDLSSTTLMACATPEGAGCTYLPPARSCPVTCKATPEQGKSAPSGSGPAALPPVLAGHYLFATEHRLPRDQSGWPTAATTAWMLTFNATVPTATWKPVATSPPVQIQAPPPTVTLLKRTLRVKGQLRLGTIKCLVTCKVTMKVSGGRQKAATTYFTVTTSKTITTPAGRRGELTVRIHVDGKLLVANSKLPNR